MGSLGESKQSFVFALIIIFTKGFGGKTVGFGFVVGLLLFFFLIILFPKYSYFSLLALTYNFLADWLYSIHM